MLGLYSPAMRSIPICRRRRPQSFARGSPDFLAKWQDRLEGENSWIVPIADIVARGYDLSARNPNRQDDYEHRPALELVQSIKAKEQRILELLDELEGMLQ